jgi:hypothetical protein
MKKVLIALTLLASASSFADGAVRISGVQAKRIYDKMVDVPTLNFQTFVEKRGMNVRCTFIKGSGSYPSLYDCYFGISSRGQIFYK